VRAGLYGGADYHRKANQTIVRFAMIETAHALDQVDAILSVEGLDAIYIGPSDLSLSLGHDPQLDEVAPQVAQAIEHILERAKAHGVRAGIHNAGSAKALQRARMGFQFVSIASDARFIASGARQVVEQMQAGLSTRA
jgi:4-hydroxy-2-oxoheptanedioate aldolase